MNFEEPRRWFNQSQPQTLQMAVMLLYINAAFLVLRGAIFTLLGIVIIGGMVAGAYGIANEQKWGYQAAVAAAIFNVSLPFIFIIRYDGVTLGDAFNDLGFVVSVMFDIALVALLLHAQSREYQKIWFR